jgi:hypothetical protein
MDKQLTERCKHQHTHSTLVNTIMVKTLTCPQRWNLKVFMALVTIVMYHNSLCVRTYLLRDVLVPPSLSPWRKLYDEGDESSFLHVTGLTREAFERLLIIVIPPGHRFHKRHRGRQWSLPPDGMLGLLLCYLGSQMTIKWLCLIFGITPSPCSRILKRILRMTVKRLRNHPLARIKFPNEEKMRCSQI